MARAIGDTASAAKSEANLAIVCELEGRLEESEKASKASLAFFMECGDVSSASRIAINLGVLCLSQDKFVEAAGYFEKAIQSARGTKNREVLGIALIDAGYCSVKTGDLSRAIDCTDEAFSIFKEHNDMNMLALAYRNYGKIELRNLKLDTAFDWFEKSVRAAEASGVEETMASCCYEYGIGLIETLANPRLAKKLLKKSSSMYQGIGNFAKARAVEARLTAI